MVCGVVCMVWCGVWCGYTATLKVFIVRVLSVATDDQKWSKMMNKILKTKIDHYHKLKIQKGERPKM